MAQAFTQAILDEATKLIRRHEDVAARVHAENVRRARRVLPGSHVKEAKLSRLSEWSLARGFNPYLVRSSADRIGHSVREAVRGGVYAPRSPALRRVPKIGGYRDVSLFQIADNAVSRLIYRRLLQKNRPLLSARSYAYRADLTTHDSLQFIAREWRDASRVFIAEYDFSKYFDTISHGHILQTIKDEGFLVTDSELAVIESFLRTPLPAEPGTYDQFGGEPRTEGIPQGTSISLFLANVALTPLDRALERLGVGFVRYADDTMIWSREYEQVVAAAEELHRHAEIIGSDLNLEKSSGIRLLLKQGARGEIESTAETDFIGYELTIDDMRVKSNTVNKIKERFGVLIYENLLRAPIEGTFDPKRFGRVDKDYVTFIWQARRYLYGDLSENHLRRYLNGGIRMRRFKGVMAFYPLVTDFEQLRELDRWLSTQAWLAMRKRGQILRGQGHTHLPPPHDLDREDLIKYQRRSATTGGVLDLRLPSFLRIAGAVTAAAKVHGPNQVGQGGTKYY